MVKADNESISLNIYRIRYKIWLRRRFEAFDTATINQEFRNLPHEDKLALTFAMENYQKDTGINYKVKSYGEGLMMITDGHRLIFE